MEIKKLENAIDVLLRKVDSMSPEDQKRAIIYSISVFNLSYEQTNHINSYINKKIYKTNETYKSY